MLSKPSRPAVLAVFCAPIVAAVHGILTPRLYPNLPVASLVSSLMTLLALTVAGLVAAARLKSLGVRAEEAEKERKLAEQKVSDSEGRFRSFFENSIDAMFLAAPDGTILSANPEASRIFGMTEEEMRAAGRESFLENDALLKSALDERRRTGKFRGELTGKRKDGTKFPVEISTSVFVDENGRERTSSTLRDMTEQKRMQRELRESNERLTQLSNTDHLTGLFNRRYLMEAIDREARRLRRSGSPLTLVLFDIDHFKLINDVYGHPNGDTVLVAIAEAAVAGLRCYDVAARYGGEEFVLLLPETDLSGGVVVAERLRESVQAISFSPPMENLGVTVSVGVATFPSPSVEIVDALFAKADEALYRAKKNGRNRVEIMAAAPSPSL